jgi:hypothetical protein
MGSETGKIHALQETLRCVISTLTFYVDLPVSTPRMRYAPGISIEEIPAARHTKSVYNITVERQWQPLYRKCLSNILTFWRDHNGQFFEGNWLHKYVSLSICQTLLIRLKASFQVSMGKDHPVTTQPTRSRTQ